MDDVNWDMTDAAAYIVAAVIAGLFGVFVAGMQVRANSKLSGRVADLHDEVRTNHGVRQGQRIEDLTEDVGWIRRQMVTKSELQAHADHDVLVAHDLTLIGERNKIELLEAIEKRQP